MAVERSQQPRVRRNCAVDDVSCNDGARSEFFVDVLAPTIRRTVAEIRRKIIKQGKQNVVSPPIYSEKDREMMTAWRSALDRILDVFNVRSVVSVWLLLTLYSQTELVRNAHVTVSGIHHEVVDTPTIVSELHRNVVDTHTMVSDIRRNMVEGREGTNIPPQSVSSIGTLSITEQALTVA